MAAMHAAGSTPLTRRSPPSTAALIGGCVGIDVHRCAHGVLLGAHDMAGISRGIPRLGCGGTAGGSAGPELWLTSVQNRTPRSPLTCTFVELAGLEPAAFCLQTITP
jgi:hypothetical protein